MNEPAVPARRVFHYADELLTDGTVCRRYTDGRTEWRSRGQSGVVFWRDDHGMTGTDEALGRDLIKRTYGDGRVIYGREGGYGRTCGATALSPPTGPSSVAGSAASSLPSRVRPFSGDRLPPDFLTPEQEQELQHDAGDEFVGADSGSDYGDWGGPGDDGGGDFG